jgi:hypothetical protein
MSLDPKAIALQGLGFLTRLVALQGLWPDEDIPPEPYVNRIPMAHYVPKRPDNDDDVLLFLL